MVPREARQVEAGVLVAQAVGPVVDRSPADGTDGPVRPVTAALAMGRLNRGVRDESGVAAHLTHP